MSTETPVRSACACVCFEPLHGRRGGFVVTSARRRFDQFEQTPAMEAEVFVPTCLAGGREGLVVSAETVVENGGGVSGQAEQSAFTPGDSVRSGRLDHADCVDRIPSPRCEQQ